MLCKTEMIPSHQLRSVYSASGSSSCFCFDSRGAASGLAAGTGTAVAVVGLDSDTSSIDSASATFAIGLEELSSFVVVVAGAVAVVLGTAGTCAGTAGGLLLALKLKSLASNSDEVSSSVVCEIEAAPSPASRCKCCCDWGRVSSSVGSACGSSLGFLALLSSPLPVGSSDRCRAAGFGRKSGKRRD